MAVNFLKKSLKTVMSTYDYVEKPLLILIFKADHPNIKEGLSDLVQDSDFAQMANSCFYPMGLLSSSREVRLIHTFISSRQIPMFLVLRMVPGGGREIRVDDMVPFGDCNDAKAFTLRIHQSLANYLKKRNEQGSKF